MLVSAWVGLRFFVASFERGSSGLVRCEKSIGKKRGWRSRLPGLSSPARATTRSSPYGVYKHNRNDRVGQSLFMVARRSWTISVSGGRFAGAFLLWPQGCWYGGPHEATSVDFSLLPAPSPA